MNDTIYLDHKLSLVKIAERIVSGGEHITIKEVTSPVTRVCPSCGKPLMHYPYNTHWCDFKEDESIEASPEGTTFVDGDLIPIQEVEDSFHDGSFKYLDLDTGMEAGTCLFCGTYLGGVEVFCFDHIPRPEDSAKGDLSKAIPCLLLFNYNYEHLVRGIEDHKLCVVSIGTDPIGIMSYGKNVFFRADAFQGYPKEDFVTDCCVLRLDCLYIDCLTADWKEKSIGVPWGTFYRHDLEAGAVVSMALYDAAKAYMNDTGDHIKTISDQR